MVVHFPIALLSVSVLFDVLSTKWWRALFRDASLLTLAFGVLSAAVAVGTGSLAEHAVEESGVSKAVLEWHEGLGVATFWFFLGLLGVRSALRWWWEREWPLLTIGVGVVGVVLLLVASYYGGSLVYDYGAGVSLVRPSH
jgi:uncharacterized membrane protein